MVGMVRRTFILAVVLPLLVSTAHAQVLADYEKNITEYTLANGMHFIILEDHTAPVVSFNVQVNTGSVDEKYGETGMSHLMEHLAFNGTRRIGTRNWQAESKVFAELDRVYEKMLKARKEKQGEEYLQKLQAEFERLNGKAAEYAEPNEFGKIMDMEGSGGLNAYCSHDMTVFWVELPSNKTELWALMESDRLFNPVFRGFYEELEVVREERRMRVENSPFGRLMEEFNNIGYSVHPYRNPVIGYPDDLEYMTRGRVAGFYRTHYVPSNIVVAIAGDIRPAELIPLLERYFGKARAGKKAESSIPAEPPMERTERRVTVRMDSEPIFLTGFHVPDIGHPDSPVLDVCSEILAGGRTSRLYKRLVKEERIALSTASWCMTPKYPGMFYIWAVAASGHTNAELESAVMDEIEKMKKSPVTEDEIEGARARLRMGFLTGLRERRGMAEELAWYSSITGDWRNLFRYTEKLEKVTREDVTAAMNRYMRMEDRIVGTVEKE